MTDKKDVDLYEELRKTLESEDESEKEPAPGASPKEEDTEEKTPEPEKVEETKETELSEEEISKLSPRAQKRIRDLAEQVKDLASKPEEEKAKEEKPQEETKPDSQKFNNVQEFLSAVQDEPSRQLLEKFYGVIKSETTQILAPLEKANAEAKFDQEFGKYEKIQGISDYKNDLKKTFMRNPSQSLKALVSEVAMDLQLAKVKPVEKTPSTPKRGKMDTDNLDKEQLYDLLDTLKGQ